MTYCKSKCTCKIRKGVLGVILTIAFVMVLMTYTTGCAGCQQDWSHMKSELVGLNRVIILYANDGTVIKKWHTRSQVQDQGGSFRFLVDGKAIQIAGTITIEEL